MRSKVIYELKIIFALFQNEYIKYPVLYELSHKYLNDNLSDANLHDRLEELKEAIRKEIRKELKVNFQTISSFSLLIDILSID